MSELFNGSHCGCEKWVNLEDDQPKEGQRVWTFFDGYHVAISEFRGGIFYDVLRDHDGSFFETQTEKVTHWMPLPAPKSPTN